MTSEDILYLVLTILFLLLIGYVWYKTWKERKGKGTTTPVSAVKPTEKKVDPVPGKRKGTKGSTKGTGAKPLESGKPEKVSSKKKTSSETDKRSETKEEASPILPDGRWRCRDDETYNKGDVCVICGKNRFGKFPETKVHTTDTKTDPVKPGLRPPKRLDGK